MSGPLTMVPSRRSSSRLRPSHRSKSLTLGDSPRLPIFTVHFYESHVVYCPPFNEPLLDGTGFWDELERNLRKSLADPQRHEFKGIVWKNRSTGTLRFQE